jgi:hypothetical protein
MMPMRTKPACNKNHSKRGLEAEGDDTVESIKKGVWHKMDGGTRRRGSVHAQSERVATATQEGFMERSLYLVHAGNDDELPNADGWAGPSQLCVRSSGNRDSCRSNSLRGVERIQDHGEFLGGHDARAVVGAVCRYACWTCWCRREWCRNLKPYTNATLMEPQVVDKTSADGVVKRNTVTTQVIAQGPTASQEAIKMLGTNEGIFQ